MKTNAAIILITLITINLTCAISLETTTINGSIFYIAQNNGTISNASYINYTLGDYATTEGRNDMLAAQRLQYYQFFAGLARFNGNNLVLITDNGMARFNSYAFSDNQSYWRTEANRSFGTYSISVQDWQNESDDYITEDISFKGNLSLTFDIWMLRGITNITEFDSLSYSNGTNGFYRQLNGSLNYVNVTSFTVFRSSDGWGWTFQLNDQYENRLILVNKTIYFLSKLGKILTGTKTVSYKMIDVTACDTNICDILDTISIQIEQLDADAGGQCGYYSGAVNNSWRVKWSDLLGTCSLSSADCRIGISHRDYYEKTSAYRMTNSSRSISTGGSSWFTCNLESEGLANGGCTVGIMASLVKPVKNTWYYFNSTSVGRYRGLFSHAVRGQFYTLTQGLGKIAYGAEEYPTFADTVAPNVSFDTIINNTVNNFITTNGSLAWVNVTATFRCSDSGLCNNSMLYTNITGSLARVKINPLVNFWGGSDSYTMLNLSKGKMYRVCAIMNDTNGNSNSTTGAPKMCWQFAVNIIPIPTPKPPVEQNIDVINASQRSSDFWWVVAILIAMFIYWWWDNHNTKKLTNKF
jgi:hypothetical protein